ncbi:hypothetical protein SEA_MOAB_217 [Streptomyces phage Moab]|nr:hypothetical protein SEA_MOAB_217 [Streptomyces phage Moab]WMI33820.1 hypothetical protein SEA_PATELGO_218 [Streptomyces phage Patelgo]
MQVGGIYRFQGATTTVRVVGFERVGLRRYVKFETLHNGVVCGPVREVLASYAKKSWEPVDVQH